MKYSVKANNCCFCSKPKVYINCFVCGIATLSTLLKGGSNKCLYIGQSFKEINLGDIKNCLTLVAKVESLKLITRRQNIMPLKLCSRC